MMLTTARARALSVLLLGVALLLLGGCKRCCKPATPQESPGAKEAAPPQGARVATSVAAPASASASASAPVAAEEDDACCCAPASRLTLLQGKSEPPSVPVVVLKVVKLDDLTKAMAAQRGKIVVQGVWATFSTPAKQGIAQLVELQRKYAKDGVVCMSVSVDDPEVRETVLRFVKQQNATFPNYLLDEDTATWQEHWNIKAIPAVLIYARDGKQAARFDDEDPNKRFTYADVGKKLDSLLANAKQSKNP